MVSCCAHTERAVLCECFVLPAWKPPDSLRITCYWLHGPCLREFTATAYGDAHTGAAERGFPLSTHVPVDSESWPVLECVLSAVAHVSTTDLGNHVCIDVCGMRRTLFDVLSTRDLRDWFNTTDGTTQMVRLGILSPGTLGTP
jgi:hypothetical protein